MNRVNRTQEFVELVGKKEGTTSLILWEQHNLNTDTWRAHEWEFENMNENQTLQVI